jgi:hypothetical protein
VALKLALLSTSIKKRKKPGHRSPSPKSPFVTAVASYLLIGVVYLDNFDNDACFHNTVTATVTHLVTIIIANYRQSIIYSI